MAIDYASASITLSQTGPQAPRRQFFCDEVGRREFLCGGGAGLLSLILATLGGSQPVIAEAVTGSLPELDRVAVRIVIDSYQFAVAPSRKLPNLDVQHFGWGLSDKPPRRTLVSEFGLAMQVESRRGNETRNILVDFGFTPEALLNNTGLLGIDPATIDALVLSHGHQDHFGGLVGFLQTHSGKLKPKLPLFVGGEGCFCAREWTGPPAQGSFGVIDRKALEAADIAVTVAEKPALVADHAVATGQISQNTFEKVLSPSAMTIGLDRGIGCYPERLSEAERTAPVVPDQFQHEIATAFNLKGRGLVVLTSCSHRGVVNAIKEAQAASGVEKIHAVIGGFHLAPYQEDYVRDTVKALQEIDPTYVIPLHCTGEPFYETARAAMPTKLLRSYTGTRLVFEA
ncbi:MULTISPECIES: MBL fold metallo-hydrolase [unclassified Bradyrhizobium]|uniref:MBL fold metallo-hydrolase n=1 Tax=unclassified Bradyrhizobium TaxID=2631580 RepID=UPI001FF817F0|nr:MULTISPECIES: MBL fold metallo-hydrolase [unclassified Bradyrhizobium]MCK1708597.1 MBL fold metallo-hydrolase [Bradyrhizobium sp. 143]MCK1725047.1 MBL fold metallo-hydrolase [Bradyrhizobium sp. 142]